MPSGSPLSSWRQSGALVMIRWPWRTTASVPFLLDRGRYAEAEPYVRKALALVTSGEIQGHRSGHWHRGRIRKPGIHPPWAGQAERGRDHVQESSRPPPGPGRRGFVERGPPDRIGETRHMSAPRRTPGRGRGRPPGDREEISCGRTGASAVLLHADGPRIASGRSREVPGSRSDAVPSPRIPGAHRGHTRRNLPLGRNALAACRAAQGRTAEADSLFRLSTPQAWTSVKLPPAARRIARARALRFYESQGRADMVARINSS